MRPNDYSTKAAREDKHVVYITPIKYTLVGDCIAAFIIGANNPDAIAAELSPEGAQIQGA